MRTPPGGLCGRGRSLTAAVGSILLLHIVHHGLGGPLGLLHGMDHRPGAADHIADGEHAGRVVMQFLSVISAGT